MPIDDERASPGTHMPPADPTEQEIRRGSRPQDAADSKRTVSLKEAMKASDEVRWVRATHDLEFPAIPFPTSRIYRVAGEALLRALVRRHHALLRASALRGLFSPDEEAFARLVDKISDFVVQACGGAPSYTETHGDGCIRSRHFPVTIDETSRDVWLELLWRAFDDVQFPNELREEYWAWVEAMSVRLINRRTQREQPTRRSYADMIEDGRMRAPDS